MRNTPDTPTERLLKAFLIFCGLAFVYYIAGCTANLYFKQAYPDTPSPIPTTETTK